MIVLKTTQQVFLDALTPTLGIIDRRQTLPVLANVLIRRSGATIEFTTSDLELQVRTRTEIGGGDSDIATTVEARKLADILRSMPADQAVALTAKANRLILQGGNCRFNLHTLPAEEFPLVSQAAGFGEPFVISCATLRTLIEQVEYAMAVHDIRYFFNGVLFAIEAGRLRLIATDGNRLALAEAATGARCDPREVILPRKSVLELARLIRNAEGDPGKTVEIRLAPSQAIFRLGSVEFVSKLIEGRFPDYDRVIPKAPGHCVTIARAPLLASLQRAAILTSEKFRGVRMRLEPGGLQVASSNAQHEQADEDLEVDYAGERIEIGFNVTYLIDLLATTNAEHIRMQLQDAASSVLFTIPDRSGFKYVVSPMRL